MARKVKTIWCYLDGKKHCDVVQWALAAAMQAAPAPANPTPAATAATNPTAPAVRADILTMPRMAPAAPPAPSAAAVAMAALTPTVATAPAMSVPTVPPPSVPVASAPVFTQEQIKLAGAALIDLGKMGELMTLLNSFGVQAVTQLKQEQLGAFATELRKLGAQI